jgi:hypothetical protein
MTATDEQSALLASFAGREANAVPPVQWRALFAAVPTLARGRARGIIGPLIAALAHPDLTVYQPAAYLLHHLTGLDHGYRPLDTPESRQEAQGTWRRWWQEVGEGFEPTGARFPRATLIVDEIPGRIVGDDDEPPGRLLLLDERDEVAYLNERLKMPYDAARLPNGDFLVSIIRARAVWQVAGDGTIVRDQRVGGYPCSLELLPDGNILVAGWGDDEPGFVREYDPQGRVVWRHEPLRWPWKAQRLPDGNTLIADAGLNRVFEVDPQGEEVWVAAGLGPKEPALFDALGPVYCQRLHDGNTLVSIRALSRIVELDPAGRVVWEVGAEVVSNQYSAVRLPNGNTLIADAGHHRVIELTIGGRIVWERGGFGYPAKAYRC